MVHGLLNIRKLILYCRYVIGLNKKQFIAYFVSIFFISFSLILFLNIQGEKQFLSGGYILIHYYFLLFVTGTMIASKAFPETKSQKTLSSWLLLQNSLFEKYLGNILIYVVFFFIIFNTVFFLSQIAALLTSRLIFGFGLNISNPLDFYPAIMLLSYFSCQTIFIMGGIYFKKIAFLKTLTLFLLCFIIGLILTQTLSFIIFSYPCYVFSNGATFIPSIYSYYYIKYVFYGFIFILVPIFSLVISFLRLKEMEVK